MVRPRCARLAGVLSLAAGLGVVASWSRAGERDAKAETEAAVERGRVAVTGQGYLKPVWKDEAYAKAGTVWDTPAPDPARDPEGYARAFEARYGLHPAPYPNDGLPMGLRRGVLPDGSKAGIALDCLTCHGGSIGGQSVVGLGNTQLDFKLLTAELNRADGKRPPPGLIVVNTARGTVNAGTFSVILLSLRNADLSTRSFPIPLGANLPELDTPAWWHLARKESMYYDGRTPAESVRSNMQFLLGEKSLDELKALEPTFRDLREFLLSLKPPKYPFPTDRVKADRGLVTFRAQCAKCHGTYGPGGDYPNRVIPLNAIGTDPARALGLSDKFIAHYNATWLAAEHPADPVQVGYQAPPLDGLWATAPYLHNGSVPTLEHLLNSPTRPARFLRPPSTDFAHYDRERVGWKFQTVESPQSLSPEQRRAFYDTSRFGLGRDGHTFGDKLTDAERADLIEYLKTL